MVFLRRMGLAVLLVAAGAAVGAAAESKAKLIGPSVYDWTAMKPSKTPVGAIRQVMDGPTATLENLEFHITTLEPGKASHQPHRHPNEELVILRQGTVETLSDGQWKRLGPGSIIFNASNSLHALRNVGSDAAVYDVINWKAAPPVR